VEARPEKGFKRHYSGKNGEDEDPVTHLEYPIQERKKGQCTEAWGWLLERMWEKNFRGLYITKTRFIPGVGGHSEVTWLGAFKKPRRTSGRRGRKQNPTGGKLRLRNKNSRITRLTMKYGGFGM